MEQEGPNGNQSGGPGPEMPMGPGGPGPGGPPGPEKPSPELRRFSLRLIRESVVELGWRYKAYLLAYILISFLFLLPPQLLEYFTKGVLDIEKISASEFLRYVVIFGLSIAVSQWIGIFIGGILSEWLRLTVSIGLRRQVLHSLHETRIESLDVAQRGDWLTRMTSDLRNCEGFVSDSLPEQIRMAVMMIGITIMFFFKAGVVAFIPCVAVVLLYFLNIFVQKKMGPTLGRVRMLEGSIFQQMIESFEGLRTIRSYGGEHETIRKVNIGLEKLFQSGLYIIRRMGALMGLNEFASQMVITALLTIAALSVKRGSLSAEDVLVFPFYIGMFLNSAKTLMASTYEWNRFFIEGGRLAEVFYKEENLLPARSTLFGEIEKIERTKSLEVKGLTVGYGDDPPVIKDFDFQIKEGEMVGIMGPSGCGKSTFLEVMAGLRFAHEGDFTIETGSETHQWKQLPVFLSSYVEQRPYLFVGTIRENVAMGLSDDEGNTGVSDDEIREALDRVDLAGLIEKRGGLDEVLTDRGQNLSEGQRYRLALVRPLLANRPVILLDEPFAALDKKSIKTVVKALKEENERGAAIVMVTHLIPPDLEDIRIERMIALHPQNRRGPEGAPGPPSGAGPN